MQERNQLVRISHAALNLISHSHKQDMILTSFLWEEPHLVHILIRDLSLLFHPGPHWANQPACQACCLGNSRSAREGQSDLSVSVKAVTCHAECCDLGGGEWRFISSFTLMWRRSMGTDKDGAWSKMRLLLSNNLHSPFENMQAFIGTKGKQFINSNLLRC